MKKINKKKIGILIAIVLIIVIAIIFILNNQNNKNKVEEQEYQEPSVGKFESTIDIANTENSKIREDGIKVNTSSKITKGIKYNDMLLTDIAIEASGDMSTFNAKVENNLGKDIEGELIDLIFLDENGEKIATVETFFPDIPKDGKGYITATTPQDIAIAYDLVIERKAQ